MHVDHEPMPRATSPRHRRRAAVQSAMENARRRPHMSKLSLNAWALVMLLGSSSVLIGCSDSKQVAVTPDSGSSAVTTDAGTDAAASQFTPACHADDGRCVVCKWSEDGRARCRVTIFGGLCPSDSEFVDSCPPAPAAACDRAPDYFAEPPATSGPYADWDFYYGDATSADEEHCLASEAPLAGDRGPAWVSY